MIMMIVCMLVSTEGKKILKQSTDTDKKIKSFICANVATFVWKPFICAKIATFVWKSLFVQSKHIFYWHPNTQSSRLCTVKSCKQSIIVNCLSSVSSTGWVSARGCLSIVYHRHHQLPEYHQLPKYLQEPSASSTAWVSSSTAWVSSTSSTAWVSARGWLLNVSTALLLPWWRSLNEEYFGT